MEWVKLYGRPAYYHDGGLLRAGEAAEVLFCRALAHCAAQESRGVIDKAVLPMLVTTRAQQRADALVREGLWVEESDRYLVRNWHKYQEEHDAAVDRKVRDRERKRAAREAERVRGLSADSVGTVRAVSAPDREGEGDRDREGEGQTEVPTAPLPRARPSAETRDEPAGFAEWYAAYPRHTARAAAAKAYAKAVRDMSATSVVAREVLLDAARRFAADPTRQQAYTPHPATWLNRGQWDDEGPARPQPASRSEQRHQHNLGVVALFAEREADQSPGNPLDRRPTTDELLGADPDWCGGRSVDEYIADQRRGGERQQQRRELGAS